VHSLEIYSAIAINASTIYKALLIGLVSHSIERIFRQCMITYDLVSARVVSFIGE